MSGQEERNQPHRGRITATGIALIAFGLLIILPLGLCATVLGFGIGIQATTYELASDALFVFALNALFVFGLIAFGAAMIYAAWKTVYQGWNTRK